MNDPIVVVCSSDNHYAMPLAVTLRSATDNLIGDRKLLFYVLDGGISRANKQKIINSLPAERASVTFLNNIDKALGKIQVLRHFETNDGFKEPKYITRAAYYRLVIPEMLPNFYDRAIYLDCDIVVRGNLTSLWEVDMKEKYISAVQEIATNFKYFNSGVMLLDLKQWRDHQVSSQLIEYLRTHRNQIKFHDQDILNAVLSDKWLALDLRWNVTPNIYARYAKPILSKKIVDLALRDPYIIHYASSAKPWNTAKSGFENDFAFSNAFFDYLDNTAWAGWRLNYWRLLRAKFKRKFDSIKAFISYQCF